MTAPSLAGRALDGFRRRFHREPEGLWSAPGRVNLIGEHTDYNEGVVLPLAIDRRVWVAAARRPDGIVRMVSDAVKGTAEHPLGDISPRSVRGWAAYPLGTVWGLTKVADDDQTGVSGFDAYFTADVPLGAGLSSSAAIECSLAVALSDLWHLGLDGDELLRATHMAENEVVGAPTGILDQSASLFGRAGYALFIDCRDTTVERVPFDLESVGLSLVVIDTRVAHAHVDGGYAARRASCRQAADQLRVPSLRSVTLGDLFAQRSRLDDVMFRQVRHVITENERVLKTVALLRENDQRAIGELLVESHSSLRDDFEVSVPELDIAVDAALGAGAVGARMTGGGFGGSAIALVDTGSVPELSSAVRSAFAARDFAEPNVFPVSASRGAGRE